MRKLWILALLLPILSGCRSSATSQLVIGTKIHQEQDVVWSETEITGVIRW